MVCTRPDLSHAVSVVSRYMHNPGKNHWKAVKWILCYVKGTVNKGLVFDRNKASTCDVTGFVDSDYAGDLDRRRSIFGYLHYVYRSYLLESIFTVYCSSIYYRG